MGFSPKRVVNEFVAGALSEFRFSRDFRHIQVVHDYDAETPHQALLAPIRNDIQNAHFEQAVARINQLGQRHIITDAGYPLLSVAADLLLAPYLDNSIEKQLSWLPYYKAWFERRPDCPFAAASYARAHGYIGHSYRGDSWASEVTEEGWAKLAEYKRLEKRLFDQTETIGRNHPFWLDTWLNSGLAANFPVETHFSRFQIAMNANPYAPGIHDTMCYLLLPRWYGSHKLIEETARYITDRTKEQWGALAYARAFHYMMRYEYRTDWQWDWALLTQGYQDWWARCPTEYVRTALLGDAYLRRAYEECLQIASNMKHFICDAWIVDEDVAISLSICRQFSAQKKSA